MVPSPLKVAYRYLCGGESFDIKEFDALKGIVNRTAYLRSKKIKHLGGGSSREVWDLKDG